jgi:hypothetical protein
MSKESLVKLILELIEAYDKAKPSPKIVSIKKGQHYVILSD